MNASRYATDLTDAQWEILRPLLPAPKRTGRPPAGLREVVNGIFYLLRTGCQWRMLPKEFPPWSTVHTWYRRWRLDGTWEKVNDALRRRARVQAGRDPEPKASAIDSQSVKTTEVGGERGFDAGKLVSGRKRHIWVCSLGFLLGATVTGAGVHDAAAACDLLSSRDWGGLTRLEVVYADNSYRAGYLKEEVFDHTPFKLHVVSRPADAKGFVKLPQRWVAERTFAWLGRSRRLSKDYEHLTDSSEAMLYASMTHLMVKRLAPCPVKHSQRFRYAS